MMKPNPTNEELLNWMEHEHPSWYVDVRNGKFVLVSPLSSTHGGHPSGTACECLRKAYNKEFEDAMVFSCLIGKLVVGLFVNDGWEELTASSLFQMIENHKQNPLSPTKTKELILNMDGTVLRFDGDFFRLSPTARETARYLLSGD